MLDSRAGKPAEPSQLIDPAALERAYYLTRPDPNDPRQQVSFGTSGHRGTPSNGTFTETHILAITQAICEYRSAHLYSGPLYLGKDTHLLSGAAERTALEVLSANGVDVYAQSGGGFTPTPVISYAILAANRGRAAGLADGIVITPSHNPPDDGGFKYNPPEGGPAGSEVTGWIEDRANELLKDGNRQVRRTANTTAHPHDFVTPYLRDLATVVDLEAIRSSGLHIGVDPLGGASVGYWQPLAEMYGLHLDVVNPAVDPTFRFMRVDHDGQIRMDCSSPYAMAGLVELKDRFDIAFGNDPDADRHGIVTRSAGLLNPNHYLAVAIDYLFTHRSEWGANLSIGKTLVSSALIDRVGASLGRRVFEVPVGFKWFTQGLYDGTLGFAGEESAGACFLRRNSTVWCTDKDGLILGLLAAEITAVTGKDPGEHYRRLSEQHGVSYYVRQDTPATPEQKSKLLALSPSAVQASVLAGDPIVARLTVAPGNQAPIGGLKVTTANGWFAARPSGTEDLYKLYAESFVSQAHLDQLVSEARALVLAALTG